MATVALTREEGWGLAISIAGHAALLAVLLLRPSSGEIVVPPERVEVTISQDVGLTSTAPDPAPPAASQAPELGESAPDAASEAPAPPEPKVIVPPAPVPLPVPKTSPLPRPTATPLPKPRPTASPKPTPRPTASPSPRPRPSPSAKASPRPSPTVRPSARPSPARTSVIDRVARPSGATPAPRSTSRPGTGATNPRPTATAKAGGSRIGSDFLKGANNPASTGASGAQAAAAIGPQVRTSLSQSVLRQVRPHWQGRVPQGVNTDQLITILSIELKPDGTLAKVPTIVRQEGVDDSNRQQAQRHAEEAIRAVQLAAPFDLPPDLYEGWKKLPPLRFRKTI
jgi:outer membrane biosynthesis protein TonB